jgi:hypothetical protein
MSELKTDEIDKLQQSIKDITTRLTILEGNKEKSFNQRMTYLTWNLSNPISLIFIPAFISIGIEILINNWGSTYDEWTIMSLTKNTNWTIPLLVATVGLIVSFGNKLYLIIQEKGDMNLVTVLRAELNGAAQRMDAENKAYEAKRDADKKADEAKRDADKKADEAKRDADKKADEAKRDAQLKALQDKHDAEYALLVEKLSDVKIRQAITENEMKNIQK